MLQLMPITDPNHTILKCSEAIVANPENVEAYLYRGAAQRRKGNFDAAVVDFSRVIALTTPPADEPLAVDYLREAYIGRGIALAGKGDADAAIDDFNRAVAIPPDYYWAYYNRGIWWWENHEYEKAIADLSRALALNPECAHTCYWRGTAWKRLGQLSEARLDFARVREICKRRKISIVPRRK